MKENKNWHAMTWKNYTFNGKESLLTLVDPKGNNKSILCCASNWKYSQFGPEFQETVKRTETRVSAFKSTLLNNHDRYFKTDFCYKEMDIMRKLTVYMTLSWKHDLLLADSWVWKLSRFHCNSPYLYESCFYFFMINDFHTPPKAEIWG